MYLKVFYGGAHPHPNSLGMESLTGLARCSAWVWASAGSARPGEIFGKSSTFDGSDRRAGSDIDGETVIDSCDVATRETEARAITGSAHGPSRKKTSQEPPPIENTSHRR